MHLEHQSIKSIVLFMTRHLPEDSCRSQHADHLGLFTVALSDTFLMFSNFPFFTVPSSLTTTIIIAIIIMEYFIVKVLS